VYVCSWKCSDQMDLSGLDKESERIAAYPKRCEECPLYEISVLP